MEYHKIKRFNKQTLKLSVFVYKINLSLNQSSNHQGNFLFFPHSSKLSLI